jgi:hypothetical protein
MSGRGDTTSSTDILYERDLISPPAADADRGIPCELKRVVGLIESGRGKDIVLCGLPNRRFMPSLTVLLSRSKRPP